MSKGFASNYRIVLVALGVLLCFGGIGFRLVDLHVLEREKLVQYAEKARRRIDVEPARRGNILDVRGDVLATSRSMLVLQVDPQALRPQDEAKWPVLARLIGLPASELETIFRTKTRPEPDDEGERLIQWAKLHDGISESLYAEIQKLNIKGVYGTRSYSRTYPHNRLAAHLIGYVNKEQTPTTGIEAYADFYLRGQSGWRESEKDGRQRELAQFRSREVPSTDGYHVVLSIDSVIQSWVEEELDAIVANFNPDNATIIVSDARTGFLLALGNYPTFNLNEFNTAPMAAQKNFAIASQIEPGSTFKIVAASGALNDGLVMPQTQFDCTAPTTTYKGRTLKLMRDDHEYDHPLSVNEIISHSSNRGASQIAMRLGDEKFYDYARAFGFGQLTGFPFGGEINGELHHPKKWSGIDITRIPAGYSIAATPLQIHCAMGVIASGGELLRPQLIREIRDAEGETVYRFGGLARQRVIDRRIAEQMAFALMGVVAEGGTAPKAAIPGYQVAAKTGTAQKIINGVYSNKDHVGSFVGFFPASRPDIVITVIVDNGKMPDGSLAYGSKVAAPSFKRVAEKLIQYLDIKPVFEPVNRPLVAQQEGARR